jgi:hypothetical protein
LAFGSFLLRRIANPPVSQNPRKKKTPWIDLLLPAGTVAEKNSTFVAASASSVSSS